MAEESFLIRFAAALERRDAGRKAEAEANEELGELFAEAIDDPERNMRELIAEATLSPRTAYAMAKRAAAGGKLKGA